ncbi:MAG: 54S ribosomal protein L4 mitochondrial [Heterodermia speciosa]|uniref:Large ribosomal subunit protein uL29m n=1 Tax=Heterodermia speciosa TaxID=116794 RepID=A0A8H3FT75_9LECA|nr:MAG: 54S ribosomal protein L4 mitochondrial [Heterodermia speciosa]
MTRFRAATGITLSQTPPVFLAPLLARGYGLAQHNFQFSTSTPWCKRKTSQRHHRDSNPDRGVSALRRSGLRHPVSMSKEPLPQPVLDHKRRKIEVAENHGLWGFFNKQKTVFPTPKQDDDHGRPWTVEELRHKSWEDLHALWWICCKERNRIATQQKERWKLGGGNGNRKAKKRDRYVQQTQRAIKHTLTERYYAWENARRVAMEDPQHRYEVNLDPSEEHPAYTPRLYEDNFTEQAMGVKDSTKAATTGV